MATYNDGLGYNLNSPGAGYPAHTNWREAILETTLNITEIVAARAEANLPALADGDTLEIHSIPSQCLVLAVGAAIEEVGTASMVAAVGDNAGVNGYVDVMAVDAIQSRCSVGSGLALEAGKYYDDVDTLTITLSGAVPDSGIIRVWAKVVDGAGQVAVSSVPGATPPNP